MRLYSYILRLDTGFAPNPFNGYCTLATCKPKIRKAAQIGDWIIGTGSKSRQREGYLAYAMRVTEAMSFDKYWNDPRFKIKRPNKKAGREMACGDNVYQWNPVTNQWDQEKDSYHCDLPLGHDTKTDRVLISDDFIYWGGSGPPLPPQFSGVSVLSTTQGHKCRFDEEVVEEFVKWIRGVEERGRCGARWNGPMADKSNKRYSDWPIPPGEGLQEETEFRGISAEQLAELCDEAVENIKQVFKGSREITPDLAESLERILGIKAYIWLGLEENYQETLERIGEVRPS